MNKDFFDKIGKARLTIGRVCSNGQDYIKLELEDELSSVSFLELNIPFSEFAQCITGSASQKVDFGVRGLNKIGMKLETKVEHVHISDRPNDVYIDKCVRSWETDGWIGRRNDCRNHHNHIGQGRYRVSFHRWVPVEEIKND